MRKQIFVVKHPEGWAVKHPRAGRASLVTLTQRKAIELAKRMAKKLGAELTIQRRNGRFREANSYGRDTYPPKG